MASGRSSRLRGRLAVSAVATLLALAGAEVALRIALPLPRLSAVFDTVDDPELLYEPVPGASVRFPRSGLRADEGPGALVTIDARGQRSTPAGDPGCAELWLAGDSYAFGWGVSDSETYGALLQERLRGSIGCRPAVRNLAVGGYHMDQIAARVRKRLEGGAGPPSLLLVHTAGNDGIGDINWASPVGIPRWATSRLHLLNVINLVAVSRQYAQLEFEPGRDERLATRLRGLATWAEGHDVPLWMIWQPHLPPAPRQAIQGRERGETDLGPCNGSLAMHLSEEDDHYSVAGHRCIVDLLEPGISAALRAGGS